MRTILPCVGAGLLLSCFGGPRVVDAQYARTACKSWSSNALFFDLSIVDSTTGSCIYGQKMEGYPASGGICPIATSNNGLQANPTTVTEYRCQCMTQAEANGGVANLEKMERKHIQKTDLRRAGWVWVALFVLGICAACKADNADNDKEAGSVPIGLILMIIFLACGYTNRDLFDKTKTPYVVGCGSQAESIGAYTISDLGWSPSVVGPSPSPPATMCSGCSAGTTGVCKQAVGDVCVPLIASATCPAGFAPCGEVQERDGSGVVAGDGGDRWQPLPPVIVTKEVLSGGELAGIVLGSLLFVCICCVCLGRNRAGGENYGRGGSSSV